MEPLLINKFRYFTRNGYSQTNRDVNQEVDIVKRISEKVIQLIDEVKNNINVISENIQTVNKQAEINLSGSENLKTTSNNLNHLAQQITIEIDRMK